MRLGAVVAGALALLVAGCGAPAPVAPSSPANSAVTATAPPGPATATASAGTPPSSPSPTAIPARCSAEAAALNLKQQVGQLLMVGVSGGLDAAERDAISKNLVGSALLLGNSTAGVSGTRTLTSGLAHLTESPLLVAVDQEGGRVQRLAGRGFDTIPSAAQQAKLDPAELTRQATRWARQLHSAGVRLNLAPVADVVPAAKRTTNQPIGRLGRGYGADPTAVSASVRAFVGGMHAGGVGATVKHFPGLGEVTGNTDVTSTVVDTVTRSSGAGLRPFRDAVTDGVDAVMIASATYRRIDPDHIAVFSAEVIGIVRGWGFDGVVISDDLGAAAALRPVPARDRAVRFIAAGGDLAINADPALTSAMAAGLIARAKADKGFAGRVAESAARVLALKADLGLGACR